MKEQALGEAVGELLGALGVTVQEDDPLLPLILGYVQTYVLNEINGREIPQELHDAVIQRAAGEYLAAKQRMGQLEDIGLILEQAVKQIQEGDTNTVFAIGSGDSTPEQRLGQLITGLSPAGISFCAASGYRTIRGFWGIRTRTWPSTRLWTRYWGRPAWAISGVCSPTATPPTREPTAWGCSWRSCTGYGRPGFLW